MAVKDKWIGRETVEVDFTGIQDVVYRVSQKDERICVAYLFGSRANGSFDVESDVDIGIYTCSIFDWDDFFRFYEELSLGLRSDRLDVVWLNKADPIFCFWVLREGRILYCRDELLMNEWELLVRKMCRDMQIFLSKKLEEESGP